MKESASQLTSIAIDYLYEGMVVNEDIYNHNGRVLLLTKGTVLTPKKIKQLKEFKSSSGNISVFESTYRILMQHGIDHLNSDTQQQLEKKVGYTQVSEETSVLFEGIKSKEKITHDEVDCIAHEISESLHSMAPATIFQCINSPKPMDEYLRRHSINVSLINGLMGRWLGLSIADIDQLVLAGLVHDIGKTKIPSEILNVPRKLLICEFEAVKMHPIYSYDLLSTDKRCTDSVRLAARHHHEKMNGGGYPDRLNANKIPLFAKITAVSDIYDAMVSKRTYKEAYDPFSTISKLAGQQFSELDINLVKIFTAHMPFELVGKSVYLSDGSIGSVKYIVPNDLEHPLVDVDGVIKKLSKELFCINMVYDDI